jgi:hypothetical protein
MMQILAYLLVLTLYLGVAVAAWIGCALAALDPARRRTARRVALSIAATFPGVFLCQALVFPLFVACVGTALVGSGLLESANHASASAAVGVSFILLALALVLFASLYGFFLGWRIAWDVSGGAHIPHALDAHRPLRWLRARAIAWRETRGSTRSSHSIVRHP